ncbi:fluoride efflux transporter FluC [Microbacterium phosphatis]|uniref:fluoride efflux transporter FluC n=1 Tax=Microbacterium phosphatis TaxID=3140248 RepID=UPI003140ABD1
MTPLMFLALMLCGGLGASLRWLADVLLSRVLPAGFPWAILIVNATGSLALGLLTGLSLPSPWLAVVGMGLLGGYTTFSTVAVDTQVLARSGRGEAAWGNALGTLVLCVALATAGLALGIGLTATA